MADAGVVRRIVTGAARLVAAIAGVWTVVLFVTGGIDLNIAGREITSHEPLRPLLITATAIVLLFLAGGDDVVTRAVRRLIRLGERVAVGSWDASRPLQRRLAALSAGGQLDRAAVGVMAGAVLVAGLVNGSRAAGGSDAYGYISEAELFLRGHLKVAQPWVAEVPWPNKEWTFSPLAYKPAPPMQDYSIFGYRPADEPWSIVPTYSPGLPILMAAAKFVAGNDAMFWIVPISGGLFVLATYGIGCRLGSRRLGTMAAFLIATAQQMLAALTVPMTDLPVAAAWAVAIWGLMGVSLASAGASGIALGISVLIRPNLAPLLPIVGVWMLVRLWQGAPHRWRHFWRSAIVIGGGSVGAFATAWIFWTAYGSPLESGYGPAKGYFAWRYVAPNFWNYTRWMGESSTPIVFLGLAALVVPWRRLWPGATRTNVIMCAAFVAAIWAEFLFYLVADNPGYLRFFLPSYPFMMLGLSAIALWIARLPWRAAGPAAGAAVIAMGCLGYEFASRSGVFNQWQESISVRIGEEVRLRTPDNSVVLAMQHSGAIRYYAGRVTLRWDNLPAEWLDDAVAWLGERGVRTYALLDGWERDQMQERFSASGQALVARLEEPPIFSIADKLFFDLSAPDAPAATVVVPPDLRRRHSQPPAPPPTIILKKR